MKKSIAELDPNFKPPIVEDGLAWHSLSNLMVEGLAWPEESDAFCRLPDRAKGVVRDPVWELSRHSAGVMARFYTDATSISARWDLRYEALSMEHMPSTGMSGLDLYARDGERWRWVGTGSAISFPRNEKALLQGIDNSGIADGEREYSLYLPLYNGATDVQIGLPEGASLRMEVRDQKPICFYGTSIVHGGCACRTGMAYPAIVGRHLDWTTLNLGFSGNGQAEPEVASLLAELDPAVFVIDCLPNLDAVATSQRVKPFVEIIRAARPNTPIVLVENITYQADWIHVASNRGAPPKNAELQEIYRQLQAEGWQDLYYVGGDELLGDDGEGTVDGTHPTDLGFLRMAETLEPVLRKILTGK